MVDKTAVGWRQKDLADLGLGKHHDRGKDAVHGLILLVRPSGKGLSRGWILRIQRDGRRREFGLGPLGDVPLVAARLKARNLRGDMAMGRDPQEEKRAAKVKVATFRDIAEELLRQREPLGRNAKHRSQWRVTVEAVYGVLGAVPVAQVTPALIAAAVEPIWRTRPETARRTLQRIGSVLRLAQAKGLIATADLAPAARTILGKQGTTSGHFKSLPVDLVPVFWRALADLESVSAAGLRFAILTASRTGPVRFLEPGHLSDDLATWTAPAAVMKTGKAFRTPLSVPAQAILREMMVRRSGRYVFPGSGDRWPLSTMALLQCCRGVCDRMGIEPVTVHGFRSSFRVWVEERTSTPHAVAEAALAHLPRDKVVAAYQRSDLLDLRRPLMDAWAAFVTGSVGCDGQDAEP